MNVDIFAEWLRRRGHHVIQTESSYWYNQGPRAYQAFPYHWIITPTEAELNQLLKSNKIAVLRYSAPFEAEDGMVSYHAVYEQSEYNIDQLRKWTRRDIRRGLRRCQVEKIEFDFLAKQGWTLQADTLNRQERDVGDWDREQWLKLCDTAADLASFEAWGALINDILAASVITFNMDGWIYMLYQQSHRDYLSDYVNNALSYVVTEEMIGREDIKGILYGLHSLDAPPSVDEFKFRMGYSAKPVRQRVVFHPWLAPLINRYSYALVRKLNNIRPKDERLSKIEGMFRFYLEGKLPGSTTR